jgi:hypothetical protein
VVRAFGIACRNPEISYELLEELVKQSLVLADCFNFIRRTITTTTAGLFAAIIER